MRMRPSWVSHLLNSCVFCKVWWPQTDWTIGPSYSSSPYPYLCHCSPNTDLNPHSFLWHREAISPLWPSVAATIKCSNKSTYRKRLWQRLIQKCRLRTSHGPGCSKHAPLYVSFHSHCHHHHLLCFSEKSGATVNDQGLGARQPVLELLL